MKLSKDGVAISDEKVKALKEAAPPKSASELRSFLGLSIWCSFHIPDLATIAQPLWDLTREGTAFRWEENHAKVFEGIKARLITTALRFFNIDWITQVICDASPVGLGAVLSQTNPKNEKEKGVVMYFSRMLTDVERRYSQVEKEALGIVWACERLYLYLFGKQFQLITDNRAVQLIFNNPNSNPPLRIRRMALRLMDFDYTIIHKPGAYNIADYLSRNTSQLEESNKLEKETENYVSFISEHAIPKAFTRNEIIEETKKDKMMIELIKLLEGDREQKHDIQKSVNDQANTNPFTKILEEITITTDGLIMRGNRVIIPET